MFLEFLVAEVLCFSKKTNKVTSLNYTHISVPSSKWNTVIGIYVGSIPSMRNNMFNKHHTKYKGDIAVSKTISNLTEKGFIVFTTNIKLQPDKIIWPGKEELQKLIWEKPCAKIAKELGVSDKAIEKRCKKYGIEKPPRGYWAKLNKL
jgi:biotin operon repressor